MRLRLAISCSTILLVVAAGAAPARAGAAPVPCAESSDHVIEIGDLLALLAAWGPCAGELCQEDLDADGTVTVADLLLLLSGWGQTCFDAGVFSEMWINGGPACGTEPPIQVHRYNENLWILRQSLCTNFEAPFIYLVFGHDRVLMQDTGAGGVPIADTVYAIIDQWLAEHDQESIELIVTHSHGHGDHVAGDGQFIGQPNTTLVGTSAAAVQAFFGITDWPEEVVQYGLGGRKIDVIPIPGHQSSHVALYDAHTGLLFTGDTLYPGRLYISVFSQYVDSIQRLVDFTATLHVQWVLGTHIEMSNTPGVDFPLGSTHHPDEHPLELTRDHLVELLEAVIGMQGNPVIEVHDEFIVFPL